MEKEIAKYTRDPTLTAAQKFKISDDIRKRFCCGKCRRDWLGDGATDMFNASQYDFDHLFKKGLMEVLLKACRKRLKHKHNRKNLFAQLLRGLEFPNNCSANPTNYFKRLDKKGALNVGSDVSMDEMHYVFLALVHVGQDVLSESLYTLCVEFWCVYVAITDPRGIAEHEVLISFIDRYIQINIQRA
jgi:hypothetical protein